MTLLAAWIHRCRTSPPSPSLSQPCRRPCITAAWQAHPAVAGARALIGSRLLTFGKKHARLVTTYRQRIGRPGDYDAVRLLAARWEYRQRHAIAAMPLAA